MAQTNTHKSAKKNIELIALYLLTWQQNVWLCKVIKHNHVGVNLYLLLKVDHNLVEQNNIYVINFYNIDHKYRSSHNIHNNYNLIALGWSLKDNGYSHFSIYQHWVNPYAHMRGELLWKFYFPVSMEVLVVLCMLWYMCQTFTIIWFLISL